MVCAHETRSREALNRHEWSGLRPAVCTALVSAHCECDVGEGGMLASRQKRVRARTLPIDQRGMSQQKM
jgi:hypothetical protein